MSVSKPYAHAQYGKLVLVLVLVLRFKGPYLESPPFLQPQVFTYVHYVMTEDIYTDLEREELKEASLNSLQVGYVNEDTKNLIDT